jgi:hypothetical protein
MTEHGAPSEAIPLGDAAREIKEPAMADNPSEQALAELMRLADPAVLEKLTREELYATVNSFLRVIIRQQAKLDELSASVARYLSERDQEKLSQMLADTKHAGSA